MEALRRTAQRSGLARIGDYVSTGMNDRAISASARFSRLAADRLSRERERRRIEQLDDADWLTWAYQTVLHREPDPIGYEDWLAHLRRGAPRAQVHQALSGSPEAVAGVGPMLALESFHGGRVAWVKSLPSARRILDLGGTALGSELGSLVVMGYPYEFEMLTIVELPSDDRHLLYQVGDHSPEIMSVHGPIRYQYQSMVDLANVPDGSVDMVVSGQTFEHITESEGRILLDHVARVLAPDGRLALDTPNRAITEIHCAHTGEDFINPDHKVEYTHGQMMSLFARAGLVCQRAQGIGYMPKTARSRTWMVDELVEYPGLYDAIEDCYTLAYLAGRSVG